MIEKILEYPDTIKILISIFLLCLIIQLVYYLFIYSKVSFSRKRKTIKEQPPVSVIICAKNEADNLREFLPRVLEQSYPDFEVIVVNDSSTDNTDEVLGELLQKYGNLKTTFIPQDKKFSHGKKLALTIGIKAASHEWLLFTDADCFPESKHWISKMAENFHDSASIVLGYGGFERKGTLLNSIIRYDALIIAMQYITFAKSGIPYMGVGRNLAYRKSHFFKHKGFAAHLHLQSGDDDLFVCDTATNKNTRVEYRTGSHVRSPAKSSFAKWFTQKKRHLTTSGYYKMKHKLMLGGEPLSRVLFYFSAFFLLYFQFITMVVIMALIFRMIIQLVILKIAINRFNEKYLLLPSLFYDILMPFLYLVLGISNLFNRRRVTWR